METARLGRTGLWVGRIALGTMNFGPAHPSAAAVQAEVGEADAHRIMDRAVDAGINLFDTANVYGWGENRGATERIIGTWLAKNRARRDKIVLATKVYGQMSDRPNDGKLSAYHIRRAVEDSLRRLQTDHIDLYQMHHVDREAPWEEIWQAMDLLIAQGKITYVGSSNFAAWNIVQANELAARRHGLGLVSEQSKYCLAVRAIELEVLPACRAYGVGVLPWSPLGGGLLGGILKKTSGGRRATERMQKLAEKQRPQLEAYESLCDEIGQKPANVAVAWLLHQPGVTAPIVGPRTIEQLEDAIAAQQVKLPPEVLKRLDAIWPGPGGQAPEAYAW
jgi:aryl-alcohol dehydrogenase-like predicted oxidoreductase